MRAWGALGTPEREDVKEVLMAEGLEEEGRAVWSALLAASASPPSPLCCLSVAVPPLCSCGCAAAASALIFRFFPAAVALPFPC